jgi:uncharacterized repeat protein (TIGR01451 family)
MFALLALGLMVAVGRVDAQNMWLLVTASANPVGISNNLTFTITVTNLTGVSQTVVVTNTMPATAPFVSVSFGLVSYPYANTGSNVIFSVGTLTNNGIAQMAVTVEPTATGYITNTVVVVTNGVAAIVGPIPIHVTNAVVVTQADLAVTMTVPASAVYTNDWMVYGVSVTNQGPGAAPGVFLTNTLPTGVGFKSVSPASPAPSIVGSNVIFNLGTLTNGAFRNFLLTVQPTNAGVLPFVSVVGTNNTVLDPILANNLASNSITVLSYPAGQLSATMVSTQQYNPQNGLVEQSILLSNTGTIAVVSARVVVTGLTNQLFNAWGTNNGNPFVVYDATLTNNQSVNLLLQFFALNYFSFTNSQLNPFAVTNINLAPPAAAAMSTNLNIARIVRLATNDDMLIEFPSLTNRTYTVVYSDNILFANAMVAIPSIVAPANRTQWIDYGPPTTVSHPTNAPIRFYRVFLNP